MCQVDSAISNYSYKERQRKPPRKMIKEEIKKWAAQFLGCTIRMYTGSHEAENRDESPEEKNNETFLQEKAVETAKHKGERKLSSLPRKGI
jgi:hypothetical protein